MAAPIQLRLNVGGEGEEPGAINQQPEWVVTGRHWAARGSQLAPLVAAGEAFLFCRNTELPLPDETVDLVLSNNVPVDITTWLGPGIQSAEIRRTLKSGGQWLHNGVAVYTKP